MERKQERKVKVKTFCFSSFQSLSFLFFFGWLCFSHFHFSEPSPVFPLHQINQRGRKKGSRKIPKRIMASFSLLFSPLCFPPLPSVFILVCECVFFFWAEKRSTLLRIYRRDPKEWQRERVGSTTGSLCSCRKNDILSD